MSLLFRNGRNTKSSTLLLFLHLVLYTCTFCTVWSLILFLVPAVTRKFSMCPAARPNQTSNIGISSLFKNSSSRFDSLPMSYFWKQIIMSYEKRSVNTMSAGSGMDWWENQLDQHIHRCRSEKRDGERITRQWFYVVRRGIFNNRGVRHSRGRETVCITGRRGQHASDWCKPRLLPS